MTRTHVTACLTNVRAVLWAAVVAVGFPIAGLGHAGIASADPNNGGSNSGEWDIGAYDSCLQHHPPYYTDDDKLDWNIHCCYSTGGVWTSGGGCTAPPAEISGSQGPGIQRVPGSPKMSAPPPPPTSPPPNVTNLPAN